MHMARTRVLQRLWPGFGLVVFVILCTLTSSAQSVPAAVPPAAEHDGQHDFDFDIGTWKTHVSRLQHPLTGSTTWVQYDGTTVVGKVWNGKANLAELQPSKDRACRRLLQNSIKWILPDTGWLGVHSLANSLMFLISKR